MKVRELQQQLNKLDPELTILCCTQDAELRSAATLFRLLAIEEVTTAHNLKRVAAKGRARPQ